MFRLTVTYVILLCVLAENSISEINSDEGHTTDQKKMQHF